MTQRTYWASPIGSAPCDTWYSILDTTNNRKESTTRGAKTIIRQKTIRYHHLNDIRVTKIITDSIIDILSKLLGDEDLEQG